MPHAQYQAIGDTIIPEGQPGAGKTYRQFYLGRFNAADKLIAEANRKEAKLYWEDKNS